MIRIKRLLAGGSAGNQQLTAVVAAILLLLLAIEGATLLQLGSLLTVHAFVGMLLIPLVGLKLASTGWRMLRYYLGGEEYVRRGPPHVVLRVLVAPLIVLSTVVLFGTGVALLALGQTSGTVVGLHKASFIVWFGATGAARAGPRLEATESLADTRSRDRRSASRSSPSRSSRGRSSPPRPCRRPTDCRIACPRRSASTQARPCVPSAAITVRSSYGWPVQIALALVITLVSACCLNVGYLLEHSVASKVPAALAAPAGRVGALAAGEPPLADRFRRRGRRLAPLRRRARAGAAVARAGDCGGRDRDPRGDGLPHHARPADGAASASARACRSRASPCSASACSATTARARAGGYLWVGLWLDASAVAAVSACGSSRDRRRAGVGHRGGVLFAAGDVSTKMAVSGGSRTSRSSSV